MFNVLRSKPASGRGKNTYALPIEIAEKPALRRVGFQTIIINQRMRLWPLNHLHERARFLLVRLV